MPPLERTATRRRRQIHVRGIVQGVGFRPFVFRLAQTLGLSGFVLNSADGVVVEIEGSEADLARFLESLRRQPPPLAQVTDVAVTEVETNGERSFRILASAAEAETSVLVPPDVATCEDCRRFHRSRRPALRLSLYQLHQLRAALQPYRGRSVRPAAHDDALPSECAPSARRNTTIPATGDSTRSRMPVRCAAPTFAGWPRWHTGPLWQRRKAAKPNLEMIREARRLLLQGKMVAIKGLGGFHLACDAENDGAVARMRARKRRSDKPFALMARGPCSVAEFCRVSRSGAGSSAWSSGVPS